MCKFYPDFHGHHLLFSCYITTNKEIIVHIIITRNTNKLSIYDTKSILIRTLTKNREQKRHTNTYRNTKNTQDNGQGKGEKHTCTHREHRSLQDFAVREHVDDENQNKGDQTHSVNHSRQQEVVKSRV